MSHCTCQSDPLDQQRVEQMLKLARTKTDLEELVRMLDHRNILLQKIRNHYAHQLATISQEKAA